MDSDSTEVVIVTVPCDVITVIVETVFNVSAGDDPHTITIDQAGYTLSANKNSGSGSLPFPLSPQANTPSSGSITFIPYFLQSFKLS